MTVYHRGWGGGVVFERFLWINAFVTLLMVTTLMLKQSNAPASAYRGYMAGKPRFHPSAPGRNISPSGKNCFISAFVCPGWKMKNRLLIYGIKRKGIWLKDLLEADVSAVLIVRVVLFLPPSNFPVRHFARTRGSFTLFDPVPWPWTEWPSSLSITSSTKSGRKRRH